MLTPEQIAAREGRFTASCAGILMAGSEAEVLNLWRGFVGDPAHVVEDYTRDYPVRRGSHMEVLNLEFFIFKHGPISRLGEVVVNPGKPWMACTLDAWSDRHKRPVETKDVGGSEPLSTVIDRYQPQMHWQQLVTGASRVAFWVAIGAAEPILEMIPGDAAYGAELLKRATQFMRHVELMKPPVVLPAMAPPVIPTKERDMAGNNEWASEAAAWRENWAAGKEAARAEKAIKALVPADVKMAYGHGIVVTRNRAGSMSLRESGAKL